MARRGLEAADAITRAAARLRRGGGPLLVALSGGADSTAALCAAHESGLATRALHVMHGLRVDATVDRDHAAATCARIGVPLEVVELDGAALRADRRGIEAAARSARYDALARSAAGAGARIVTGHHLEDRLETVVMRLFSGAGLSSLVGPTAAMTWRGVHVVRPLVEERRPDLERGLEARGLTWVEDPMNVDARFVRSEVRQLLAPLVRSWVHGAAGAGGVGAGGVGAGGDRTSGDPGQGSGGGGGGGGGGGAGPLARSLATLEGEAALLSALRAGWLRGVERAREPGRLELDRAGLRALHRDDLDESQRAQLVAGVLHDAAVGLGLRPHARVLAAVAVAVVRGGRGPWMDHRARWSLVGDRLVLERTAANRSPR